MVSIIVVNKIVHIYFRVLEYDTCRPSMVAKFKLRFFEMRILWEMISLPARHAYI
jgi:hypothetical protein